MATAEKFSAITPDLVTGMQAAIDRALNGVRNHEAMRKACDRMDGMREETYRKHGLLDIGVPAIRELRDGE